MNEKMKEMPNPEMYWRMKIAAELQEVQSFYRQSAQEELRRWRKAKSKKKRRKYKESSDLSCGAYYAMYFVIQQVLGDPKLNQPMPEIDEGRS